MGGVFDALVRHHNVHARETLVLLTLIFLIVASLQMVEGFTIAADGVRGQRRRRGRGVVGAQVAQRAIAKRCC
jgi:hypothetical protein